jgi:hypothetical protein
VMHRVAASRRGVSGQPQPACWKHSDRE